MIRVLRIPVVYPKPSLLCIGRLTFFRIKRYSPAMHEVEVLNPLNRLQFRIRSFVAVVALIPRLWKTGFARVVLDIAIEC